MTRFTALFALLGLLLAGSALLAQKPKTPVERTVLGVVTDADGNPAVGAVVQLKNLKTLQIRSFLTREKGDYYFHGLSLDVDYEIKAQANGKDSPTRTISTFNSHPELTINLQVK
jgi:hypothetical protein